jgi:hypothetical protein
MHKHLSTFVQPQARRGRRQSLFPQGLQDNTDGCAKSSGGYWAYPTKQACTRSIQSTCSRAYWTNVSHKPLV